MQNDTIIIENAAQLLDYDPETGEMVWKVRKKGSRGRGKKAGHASHGYIVVGLTGKRLFGHRIAWFLHYGNLPEQQIDHKDRDRSNNKIDNLRIAENNWFDNHQNRSLPSNNTSGVIGVKWHKVSGKWVAQIQVNKKQIHLGLFESFEDAVAARRAAELKYFTFANP
jgi:hypothetical protein